MGLLIGNQLFAYEFLSYLVQGVTTSKNAVQEMSTSDGQLVKDMEEFTLNEDVEQSDICLDGSECCESAHDEKSVPKNCNKSEEVKQVVFGKTTGDGKHVYFVPVCMQPFCLVKGSCHVSLALSNFFFATSIFSQQFVAF